MAHHFDTRLAKEDPRLNVCDLYLFSGRPGMTTMVMTTNADVGLSSPDALHPEGLYSFRFDGDGDGVEDVVLTFRFGEPRHRRGAAHSHVQDFDVIRSTGPRSGTTGEVLASGVTGRTTRSGDLSAFVGVVPELWAADAGAFGAALDGIRRDGRLPPDAFSRRTNDFRNRNVVALVLELPDAAVGAGPVRAWATISLCGHAPEVQVCRFGVPLFTHLFLADPTDPTLVERYHESAPNRDPELFAPVVASVSSRMAAAAGRSTDPDAHGRRLAERICPSVLTYEIGTRASFEVARANGRTLLDDAYDVMWSLATDSPVSDGVAPDPARVGPEFPYYGEPYSEAEQAGLAPIKAIIGYKG